MLITLDDLIAATFGWCAFSATLSILVLDSGTTAAIHIGVAAFLAMLVAVKRP